MGSRIVNPYYEENGVTVGRLMEILTQMVKERPAITGMKVYIPSALCGKEDHLVPNERQMPLRYVLDNGSSEWNTTNSISFSDVF